ncbi:MAG: diphosphomevalonate decarboxylase [Kiritimatiellaceae bacterium]|nr:diphosphomevalonate decarboxylase [Kiritimatiellaceae bacterium]
MSDIQHQFVKKILANASHGAYEVGRGEAPSNIALCKYWGKRDQTLNLPLNGSLSISLGQKGTRTQLRRVARDTLYLNGHLISPDTVFAQRLSAFLDLFRAACRAPGFEVKTENNIPTAAGLASSASGYAALVLALNDLGGWDLPRQLLSMLARLGSGSAARSLFNGFALWHRGERDDGSDSFAEALATQWPDFRIGIIKLTDAQKPIDSRSGMQRTVNTSPRYAAWPERATLDLETLQAAIADRDFQTVGQTAEANALEMHATMRAADPPLDYFLPETRAQITHVQQLRAQGLPLYLTIDAGPNVKLLFQEADRATIQQAFPTVEIINPFGENDARTA